MLSLGDSTGSTKLGTRKMFTSNHDRVALSLEIVHADST